MSRSVHRPSPVSAWRHYLASLGTGLTLILLLGGLVVPHGAANEHSDLPIGTHLDANATHPGQPLHMETAAPEVVHACAACLLQTQKRSVLGRPSAVPLPALSDGQIVPETPRNGDAPSSRRAPARAPPAVPTTRH